MPRLVHIAKFGNVRFSNFFHCGQHYSLVKVHDAGSPYCGTQRVPQPISFIEEDLKVVGWREILGDQNLPSRVLTYRHMYVLPPFIIIPLVCPPNTIQYHHHVTTSIKSSSYQYSFLLCEMDGTSTMWDCWVWIDGNWPELSWAESAKFTSTYIYIRNPQQLHLLTYRNGLQPQEALSGKW